MNSLNAGLNTTGQILLESNLTVEFMRPAQWSIIFPGILTGG